MCKNQPVCPSASHMTPLAAEGSVRLYNTETSAGVTHTSQNRESESLEELRSEKGEQSL